MSHLMIHPKLDSQLIPLSQPDQIGSVIKAIVRTADAWKLTNAEAASLFDVPIATWSRMKASKYRGVLDQDKVTRASLMIGIFKGLRLLLMYHLLMDGLNLPTRGPDSMGAHL